MNIGQGLTCLRATHRQANADFRSKFKNEQICLKRTIEYPDSYGISFDN